MDNYIKKQITKSQIEPLCKKYNIDQILASILVRRGITEGQDVLYFLEDDMRFQHNPFLLNTMEDAVERILQAKEEGEKVLIFGDSDVDGITSTAILYGYLKKIGMDVQWRLPLADDAYGLSIAAVDDFAAQNGTLIITVDCGISNFEEIKHANDLCIDVIVTDHHNPPETLPEAVVVIDPKVPGCGYPFEHISGAAVAYKLVSALRFAQSDFYGSETCLLNIEKNESDGSFDFDILKVRNLVKVSALHETFIPGKTDIYNMKFMRFLQGQIIYVWDSVQVKAIFADIFGSNVEINLYDLKNEISKIMPALKTKKTEELKKLSLIAKYLDEENSTISALFNLYFTWCKKIISLKNKSLAEDERKEIQLVGIAALADIMPMKNENRIFVRNAIESIKKDGPRAGLAELFVKLRLTPAEICSTDLSWNVIPALNAAGRLGQSDVSLELLLSEDAKQRVILAEKIFNLNEERKNLVGYATAKIHETAKNSIEGFNNSLCVVIDACINPGVTGIVATRFMQDFNVPCIAVTYCNDICIGSMRTCRGLVATDFLDSFGDFFENHGGHNAAAGFSFKKEKLEEFIARLTLASSKIKLEDEEPATEIDAEIPPSYLSPEIFNLLERMEPFGAENTELNLMSCGLVLHDAMLVGKKEPASLKMHFNSGKNLFLGMFWNAGNRLNKDINIGEKYDIIYSMKYNYFRGTKSEQLIIKDIQKSN